MELVESFHASTGSSSTEAEEDHYEKQRPMVKSITVPETVKRRLPSKHYVSDQGVAVCLDTWGTYELAGTRGIA